MFDELGIGEVIDRATRHHPETRSVTTGDAVKAMVLNGLGCVNQQLYLVSRFFQDKPTSRLLAPMLIEAKPHNDDALGWALETLYADGVTELYSLIAATAARRLSLAPPFVHLDRTSFPVEGRYHSDHAPDEQVVHITRGYRRDHRPDLNQGMRELMVEPQAGIPVLMQPLSGHSRDSPAFGQIIQEHMAQLHTTDGATDLVADRALYREDNLPKLSETHLQWMTRVPATLSEAHAALAQADPQTIAPLLDGSRDRALTSTAGGVAPRWGLISSEPRLPQAQRTVDQPWLQPSAQAVNACKPLYRMAFAGAADAQQALATFEHGLQITFLAQRTVRSTSRDGQRGRPGADTQPDQVVSCSEGSRASRIATRQALVNRQRCFLLATNELDATQLPPQARLEGYKGPGQAERGFRVLKDPRCRASSRYLKKPERIMAFLMVMTVCWLVYAALEYRIRNALKDHGATFPNQKGTPVQNPTARWVVHFFVGIHVLRIPGQWPLVLNLTEEHQQLLKFLGTPYERFYR
jgi:transposase